MLLQKQFFDHNPPETFGDCHRTVLACLLDYPVDEVPNFSDPKVIKSLKVTNQGEAATAWLAQRNLLHIEMPYGVLPDQHEAILLWIFEAMKTLYPGVFYTLVGQSRSGCNHIVICLEDKIYWDPSKTDAGIIAPCIEEEVGGWRFYMVGFLVPKQIHKYKI